MRRRPVCGAVALAKAVKKSGVTEQTYDRGKKKYGGLRMDEAKRLKELEKETS
ncbi:MAG: IS3 family transposase, partial [Planctomycetes bacterium]|nr:IS3 family transposase [Planctomycetota bacterium]